MAKNPKPRSDKSKAKARRLKAKGVPPVVAARIATGAKRPKRK